MKTAGLKDTQQPSAVSARLRKTRDKLTRKKDDKKEQKEPAPQADAADIQVIEVTSRVVVVLGLTEINRNRVFSRFMLSRRCVGPVFPQSMGTPPCGVIQPQHPQLAQQVAYDHLLQRKGRDRPAYRPFPPRLAVRLRDWQGRHRLDLEGSTTSLAHSACEGVGNAE